jgi:hypothetical protein
VITTADCGLSDLLKIQVEINIEIVGHVLMIGIGNWRSRCNVGEELFNS